MGAPAEPAPGENGVALGRRGGFFGRRVNVHHLELFYYVAKHGGISAAVRNIPYGIQQPAVSGQMGKLEEEVGTKLFERSPFRLTPAGVTLFAHVQPFFENLGSVKAQLRQSTAPELRLAGAELILRDHLPGVLAGLRKRFPGLRLSLRTMGFQSEEASWVRDGAIDLAFAPLGPKPLPHLRQVALARFPLVLQVPAKSAVKSAEEFFAQRKISTPLICLEEDSTISQGFQRDLKRRRVTWPQTVAATSLDLVTRYVANGDGIGLNVLAAPGVKTPGVRLLPLEGFTPVTIGAMWRGELTPLNRAMLEEVRRYALKKWPEWAEPAELP
jgi:DNA-binding transcriptional LysR family regulator